jgi:hypothetical protein
VKSAEIRSSGPSTITAVNSAHFSLMNVRVACFKLVPHFSITRNDPFPLPTEAGPLAERRQANPRHLSGDGSESVRIVPSQSLQNSTIANSSFSSQHQRSNDRSSSQAKSRSDDLLALWNSTRTCNVTVNSAFPQHKCNRRNWCIRGIERWHSPFDLESIGFDDDLRHEEDNLLQTLFWWLKRCMNPLVHCSSGADRSDIFCCYSGQGRPSLTGINHLRDTGLWPLSSKFSHNL